jgi:hypothetical protein
MNSYDRFVAEQRLHDAAKLRAEELRRETMAQFWTDGGDAARHALRSAQRLAHSLARHARLRGQQGI